MKKYLFIFVALVMTVGIISCGNKKESNTNEEMEETSIENAVSEETSQENTIPESEPEQKQTINGLEPGAEYQFNIDGAITVDLRLYNDGTMASRISGDGYWRLESIHDQPFIFVRPLEAKNDYYIDANQYVHINNASSKGYKLEKINSISENDKGMVVGKRYTIPKYRWEKDAYITLNEDGTVSSEFDEGKLKLTKWKKVDVNGKQWIMVYWDKFQDVTDVDGNTIKKEYNGGYIVSPSLEYYSFSEDDKDIKYLGGELTLGEHWKTNRKGRLQE